MHPFEEESHHLHFFIKNERQDMVCLGVCCTPKAKRRLKKSAIISGYSKMRWHRKKWSCKKVAKHIPAPYSYFFFNPRWCSHRSHWPSPSRKSPPRSFSCPTLSRFSSLWFYRVGKLLVGLGGGRVQLAIAVAISVRAVDFFSIPKKQNPTMIRCNYIIYCCMLVIINIKNRLRELGCIFWWKWTRLRQGLER